MHGDEYMGSVRSGHLVAMWNAVYPYLLTIRDGEQVYQTRYASYGEAVAVYMEHVSNPAPGITIDFPINAQAHLNERTHTRL